MLSCACCYNPQCLLQAGQPAEERCFQTVPVSGLEQLLKMLVVVQSLSPGRLFETPWTAACQASLSITNSQSLLKLMSIKTVMPSNHLILCHPILLLPSVFPASGSFPTWVIFDIALLFVGAPRSPLPVAEPGKQLQGPGMKQMVPS